MEQLSEEARDVLEEIWEHLDDQADVDDGIPNDAMKLQMKLEESFGLWK